MNRIFLIFLTLIYSGSSFSFELVQSDEWSSLIRSESIEGVFVLCKESNNLCMTNNIARAKTEYIPASTFKIASSLIGLETGAIKNEFQIFKWDGKPRRIKSWEQDLTLRGAIQYSAVPVFQQIARSVGETKMQKYLKAFDYGNANIQGGIDKFWLEGGLKISAVNQISFIEKLSKNNLPVSKQNQLIVKSVLVTEATPSYLVHSKTGFSGTGTKENPGIGWWVGWIESETETYYFAFNMDISKEELLPYRKSIPKKLMESMGLTIGG